MAGDNEVTSPDQHKPTNARAARGGAIVVILALVAMQIGFPITTQERLWLGGLALLLFLILVGDAVLRRNGLRS